jgi:hypothetical protein
MPQGKAAAIVEILRSGSPQILLATIATCPVKVANAKHVRTLASLWSGHCFGLAVVPRPGAMKAKMGAIAVRRLRRSAAFAGCWLERWDAVA